LPQRLSVGKKMENDRDSNYNHPYQWAYSFHYFFTFNSKNEKLPKFKEQKKKKILKKKFVNQLYSFSFFKKFSN